MELEFWKYHGTGNDFILLKGESIASILQNDHIRFLCDRHFGVGADGLIIISEDSSSDFRMRYFNSDGNESTLCGNGGRCAVAFTDFLSYKKQTKYQFTAADGLHEAVILDMNDTETIVSLKMNDVKKISMTSAGLFLDTGSPHLVRFQEDINSVDLKSEGKRWRNDDLFKPGGTNVNFVEEHPSFLKVRSYERGVEDETLSCGTGVTASVLSYAEKHMLSEGIVDVLTKGGKLKVGFKKNDEGFSDIWLTGAATQVFAGKFNTELLGFQYA